MTSLIPSAPIDLDPARRRDAIGAAVVGRGRELDLLLAAVTAGRGVMLEAPLRTGTSTVGRKTGRDMRTDALASFRAAGVRLPTMR